jgi:trehalose 6-phosphate phosphatase
MIMIKSSAPIAGHQNELDKFMGEISQAQVSALLLDYDGTLAPFSTDRQNALPYDGVVPLVRDIMATGRTRVVMITGRGAPDIVPLLGIDPAPEVWGAHGLQRLLPDGTCEIPRLDQSVVRALWDAKRWLVDQRLEHFAEYKPGGIALHWRGMPEARAAEIRGRVVRGWFPLAQCKTMSMLEFDGGVEIRAAILNKGDAVRTIVSEMDSESPIAYLGDDVTDERAFKALGVRGLSILVRSEWRRTSARLWLKPPGELVDFLERWLQACRGTGTPHAGTGLHQRIDQ